jgi:uncharacterized protein YyaL (SSP411 family)
VADDTLRYVAREMSDPDGGFYSAEDADSLPPDQAGEPGARKSEGAFYLWGYDEIGALLGEDAPVVCRRFGVEPGGNAPADPHGEFTGRNLLYVAGSLDELAAGRGESVQGVEERMARARQVLFDARGLRPRPQLDDKVLTAWNGLMVAAFARGARVLGHADHLRSARRCAEFLRARMWDTGSRTLYRRYRGGDVAIAGFAEDYAYLVWGLLELFQADGDPGWLEWALDLQRRQDELFWDETAGGWFSTTGHDPSVLVRMKEDYDGAEPSASSVSVSNLIVLSHLTGDLSFRARIERTLGGAASRIAGGGRGVPMMLAALSAWHHGVQQVVIVGRRDDEALGRLSEVAARRYLPFAVTVPVEPGAQQERLARIVPFIGAMAMRNGRPTAYVCRDFACQAPTCDPDELAAQLQG